MGRGGGGGVAALEEEEEKELLDNKVTCQLTDPEGTSLAAPMYIPQDAGPKELQHMVNKLLNNDTKTARHFIFRMARDRN